MSVLRFLAHLLLVLSVSGALPPAPGSDASAGPGRHDRRVRLAMRLGLRMRPAADGTVTASGVSDLGAAARSRLSAQPGECGPSGLPLVPTAAGSPLFARRDPLPPAPVDGRPLRGPPPATSFR